MTKKIIDQFKLACAQLNPVVGDIDGNIVRARDARAKAKGADLIAYTELFITGYPIEDLVLKPALQSAAREACEALAKDTDDGGPAMLIGLPWAEGPFVYNAMALLDHGRVEAIRFKTNLPNYGVFDEKRVFAPGPFQDPIAFRGVNIGVPVCEDIWSEEVCRAMAKAGAELMIVPNGSPYWMDKQDQRYLVAGARVRETGLPLAYVNQFGGQDELVFDGASFALDRARVAPRKQWLGLQAGPDRQCRGGGRRELSRLRHGFARLRQQKRISRRGARALRRRRLGALRDPGGGRARGRPRSLRDAALSLHQQ
jgi:NAD+ synthase